MKKIITAIFLTLLLGCVLVMTDHTSASAQHSYNDRYSQYLEYMSKTMAERVALSEESVDLYLQYEGANFAERYAIGAVVVLISLFSVPFLVFLFYKAKRGKYQ